MKNKLEKYRKEQGITQTKLADELGVSRQTISSIENGRYNPSLVLAIKISRLLQKDIEEIFVVD